MGNCLRSRRAASWADGDEWEAEAEFCKAAAAASASAQEKAERVEVKIRVTRRQLQELLEKAAAGGGKANARQVEEVLAELMTSGRVCYRRPPREGARGHWRPSLYSISEQAEAEET